jgi:cytochrome c-type biogenesis protein CcmH
VTAFYFAAAILAGIALTMLLRPLRGRGNRSSKQAGNDALANDEVQEINNAIYRTQLAELDRDRSVGQLSEADYSEARAELQRRLLDDEADSASTSETTSQSDAPDWARRTRIALAFFLPLGALAIYSQIGNPTAALPQAEQAQQAEMTMEKMIVQLRAKLEAQPENPEGWAMLAQSYGALGRWNDAALAFTRIGPTLARDPRLMSAFAEVLARQAGGNFEGKPRTLITMALKLDPKHPYALMLAGSDAFQERRWDQAILYWEPLLAQLDPASDDYKTMSEGIAKAREMAANTSGQKPAGQALKPNANSPVGADNTPSKPADLAATAVSGRVELAAALKAKTQPSDVVFVFARAVNPDGSPGSRMPLAVQRTTVADLPFNFSLDDSQAMTTESKISGAAQLRIEARVSRSGKAIAASGDISGQSQVVKPGTKGLRVSLESLVP